MLQTTLQSIMKLYEPPVLATVQEMEMAHDGRVSVTLKRAILTKVM